MPNKLALNIIDFTTNHLANWQHSIEINQYKSLKELCDDIYGVETWKAISYFGGVDPLARLFRDRGHSSEFTNYIIDYFSEDYNSAP